MNKIYKVIWSKTKGCYVVASEFAKREGKAASSHMSALRATFATFCVASLLTGSVMAASTVMTRDDNFNLLIGANTTAASENSVVVGDNITVGEKADNSVVLGGSYTEDGKRTDTNVTALNSVVIGLGNTVKGYATDIKYSDKKDTNIFNTVIGTGNVIEGENVTNKGQVFKNVAIGYKNRVATQNAVALGNEAEVTGISSVAIGDKARAISGNTLAIGQGATAQDQRSIALGVGATTEKSDSIAIAATTKSTYSIAMGSSANTGVNANNSIAIGKQATVSDNLPDSIVMGREAKASGNGYQSVAIGTQANVTVAGGVALGDRSVASVTTGQKGYDPATNKASVNTDKTWKSTYSAVSIGNDSATRQIVNVAAGSNDTDAVNVAQLKAVTLQTTADTKTAGSNGQGKVNLATEKLNIAGGATGTATTVKNIKTSLTSDPTKIQIDLVKDVNLGANGSLTTGNTVVNNSGVKVTNGSQSSSLTASGLTVTNGPTISTSGIAMGNDQITQLASGSDGESNGKPTYNTPTNAANIGDVKNITDAATTVVINNLTAKGMDFAGNTGKVHRDLGQTLNVVGGQSDTTKLSEGANIGVVAATTGNDASLTIKLAKDLTGLNTVTASSAVIGNQSGTVINSDGSKTQAPKGSYVTGLSNTSWDVKNPSYVSGRAATEDQLKAVSEALSQQVVDTDDYRLIQNPAAGSDGAYKVANNKVTLKVKNVNDPKATVEDVVIDDVASATDLDKLTDRAVKYDLTGDTVNKNQVTLEGTNGTQIKNLASGSDGVKDGKPTYNTDTNAANIGDVKHFANEAEEKGLNFSADSGAAVHRDLGETLAIAGDGQNIATTADAKTGKVTISLTNDISVGQPGVPGKDGKPGTPGKDGSIGAKGADGSAVVLNGKDGSIGLTGPAGKDGEPGTSITIKGEKGQPGLNGTPGKDGITRIVYQEGETKHEVATLDDGMVYTGDTGRAAVKLNKTVNITGGQTDATKLAAGPNIGVVAAQNSENGKLTIQLAKDINLGNDGSVTTGNTVINNDGLTINNGPSVTNTGINAGDEQITDVASGATSKDKDNNPIYDNDTNAANIGDVKHFANEAEEKGLNFSADSGAVVHRDLGETLAIAGDAQNITTTTDPTNGKVTISLTNDISVGQPGVPGKDGQPGTPGKDGSIGAKGADGSAVVLNGKDGSIGLTGPAGKDGEPGKTITIKGIDGQPGVDGKDGITRIVVDEHEVATLEDGMVYTGDTGRAAVKLNKVVNVAGGEKESARLSSGKNIGVVADQDGENGKLTIKLAKNLTDLTSVQIGNTTINTDGLTITNGPSVTNTGIAAGDKQITDVASGATGKDKANNPIYDNDTNAANIGDVKHFATEAEEKGLNFSADSGEVVHRDLGQTLAIAGDTQNITTTTDPTSGKIIVSLTNDISVGQPGVPGKDGQPGIPGKDGSIGAKGADGSAVVLNGKDGSIGLTGPAGKDGQPGKTITIKGIDGQPGVDGKDGITRIVVDEHEVATLEDGMVYAGDQGSADVKLNKKVTVSGGVTKSDALSTADNIGVVATKDEKGNAVLDVRLAKDITGLNSVTAGGVTVGTQSTTTEGGVTKDGNFVTGLTNTTWNTDDPDIVSGRGATEDQLKVVSGDLTEKINAKSDYRLIQNPAADSNGAYKVADNKVTLKVKNVNDPNATAEDVVIDDVASADDLDKLTDRAVKYDLTGDTVNKNQVTLEGTSGTQIKNLASGSDGIKDGKLTYNTDTNAANIGDVKHFANEAEQKGLNFSADSGEVVHRDLGQTLAIAGDTQNITTTTDPTSGKIIVSLTNDISVGQPGTPGKDGSIGAKGADGSAVVLNGKDGSIGLTGPAGKDGEPGKTITIKGIDGKPGVDGKDGITRIVVDEHEVATLEDGMVYTGDTGRAAVKLNKVVNVAGGEKESAKLSTGKNIGVVADQDGENGKLTIKLAKNLTDLTSVQIGNTTINTDGLTITNGPSVTNTGIAAGDKQITDVASGATGKDKANNPVYDNDTNAANIGDVKHFATEAEEKGLNFSADSGEVVHRDLGQTLAIAGDKQNIATTTDPTSGKIIVSLTNDISVGQPGVPGKDGQPGTPGKDGSIGAKGADGSAVVLNGKDGSIGLTGPAGKDGEPGKTITIKGIDGQPGVDGKDGITRIVVDEHEVATLEDGMVYTGDTGRAAVKLNKVVNVAGGEKESAKLSTGKNIGVVADQDGENGKLTIKLAKNLTDLTSVQIGNTTINTDGLTITNGPSVTNTGIAAGDKQITDVASGATGKDKANNPVYDNDTNAANIGDVKHFATEAEEKGLNFSADSGEVVHRDLGQTLAIAGDKQNIATTTDPTSGKIIVSLTNDISVGQPGIPGKDGQPGIPGKDGSIGARGADGSAVVLNGKDGSIGLTGPAGKDGEPGKTITIKGIDGQPGVDGKDGITRIVVDEHEVATLEDGMVYAGDQGSADVKLNKKVTVSGGVTKSDALSTADNIGVVATKDEKGNAVLDVRLAKDITGLNSVTAGGVTVGTQSTTTEGGVTKDGNFVTGLTNTTWNTDDPDIVSGRGATEDQLKVVSGDLTEKINAKSDYRLIQNPAADSNGAYKVADNKVTLKVKNVNDPNATAEDVVIDDVASADDLDKLTDRAVKYDLTGDTVNKNQVTLEGTSGTQIKNLASGSDGIKDGKPTYNTDTNAANIGDVKHFANEAEEKGLNFSADSGAVVHRDLGETLAIAGDTQNIATTTDPTSGKIIVSLTNDISVGQPGVPGKDGQPGIPGKDGSIGAKGADGSAVVLNGKDGSIGLTGPAGKDGEPGKTITIKGIDGKPGVDGKDGITRIVVDEHEVATLEDGMVYTGDTGRAAVKLNKVVNVTGGEKESTNLSSGKNIGVVADQDGENGKLTIKLAKELTDLTSVQTGDTTINTDGLTITKTAPVEGSETGAEGTKSTTTIGANQIVVNGQDGKDGVDGKLGIVIGNQDVTPIITNADGGTKEGKIESGNYVTGLDNTKWNPAENGIVENRAATEGQVKAAVDGVSSDITTKGLNFSADSGEVVHRDLGETLAIAGDTQNIATTTDPTSGKIIVSLTNDISVGQPGVPGKDGQPGIPGKDGSIGAKGADGSAVVLNGKDGSIGLTGPAGKDGEPGKTITIKGIDGKPGVDGKDGITRIVVDEHEVATLEDGMVYAGDQGSAAVKLNKKVTVSGGVTKSDTLSTADNIGVVATKDEKGNAVLDVRLAKDITGLNSVTAGGVTVGTQSTTTEGGVTKDGNFVTGLTNTTWNTDDPDIVSGRGATEDQLKVVSGDLTEKINAKSDYRLIQNPAADSNGAYKVADNKVTLKVKNVNDPNATAEDVVIDDVASADDLDKLTDRAVKYDLTGDTVNKNQVTLEGTSGTQIKNLASGSDGIKDGKPTYNTDTNAANIGDVKHFANEAEEKGLNFSADSGAVVHRDLGETLAIAGDTQNIATTTDPTSGKIIVSLTNDISVGQPGVPGKDGQPGTPGKDGSIGAKGADGSAVVLNGKDGSIGLTGPAGKDGEPGKTITIKGIDGKPGVDGKDGITRIVVDEHEVATLEDGMVYTGDTGRAAVKLNKTVNITGGQTDATKLAAGPNIGVVAAQNSENGKLTIQLAKDINLGNDGSVTTGNTVINNGGLTINNGPSVTNTGINAGDKQITDVASGATGKDKDDNPIYGNDTNAANIGDVKHFATEAEEKGLNFSADSGEVVHRDLGETLAIAGDTQNIATTTDPSSGKIIVSLTNDISVGQPGVPGKDGQPGIPGKDGSIGAKGADGSAVVLNGKDGSIGLTGPAGKDGELGKTITIKGIDGQPGVDGKDGITRIVVDEHEVATLEDGMVYAGDQGSADVKLNKKVTVAGGVTESDALSAADNIGVVAAKDENGNAVLNVRLAKDINLGNDGSVTTGNTIVNNDGVTITKVTPDETDAVDTKHKTTIGAKQIVVNNQEGKAGIDSKPGIVIGNQDVTPVITNADGETKDGETETGNYITGLDNTKWDPTKKGIVENRAATEGQVKAAVDGVSSNVTTKGLNFSDDKGTEVHRDLGETLQITGDGKNIATIADAESGKIKVSLTNDLSIGVAGKDGVDGKIGINGKDGSSVVINGKDGSIGATGADGKTGVTINGKDGSIGLTGPAGKDGQPGKTITIKGLDGKDGVNGVDGQPVDRIIVNDETVATMKDGMQYAGDDGQTKNTQIIAKKLNGKLDIIGGATGTLSDNNIGVNNVNGQLKVQLADEIVLGGYGKSDSKITVGGKNGGAVIIDGSKRSITFQDPTNGERAPINVTVVQAATEESVGGERYSGDTRLTVGGANGADYIAYTSDGYDYQGDIGEGAAVGLNSTVSVTGGITREEDLAKDPNIGVIATSDTDENGDKAKLELRLAKDLKGLNSAEFGTVLIGKQPNGNNPADVRNYVTGLDNKEWDKDNIVSGRAATEDQLKAATDAITSSNDGGGFGLADQSGETVKKDLGQTITIKGGATEGTTSDSNAGGVSNITTKVKDGALEISLNNKIDLGKDGSVKVGETTIDKDGIKTNNVTAGSVKAGSVETGTITVGDTIRITKDGINAGGTQLTNVDSGKSGTDADGKPVYNIETNGANIGDVRNIAKYEAQEAAEGVRAKTGKNITVKPDNTVNLNDKVEMGDGQIIIDATDKGLVTIGKENSIKIGSQKVSPMKMYRDVGDDGTETGNYVTGLDNIVWDPVDHGYVPNRAATEAQLKSVDDKIERGRVFAGDSGSTTVGLGETLKVQGGISDTSKLSDNNIGVVADGNQLLVKLGKELSGLTSVTTTDGTNTTVVNGGGVRTGDDTHNTTIASGTVTLAEGDQNTVINANGLTISDGPTFTRNKIDAAGNQITGVADGKIEQGSKDAINGGQLFDAFNNVGGAINKLGNRINRVGAGAAALAALHPLDFDPDEKWDFAGGYGNYRGANAVAVGAFYRPNEDTLFSVGGSFGGGENMVNAGVSFKVGQGNHVSTSRVAMAKEIKDLRQEVEMLRKGMVEMSQGKQLDPTKTKLFPDVDENHWAYNEIAQLAGNGIVEGYPDGNFGGDRMMTRYEFAMIVYRQMQQGAKLSSRLINEFIPELERIRVDVISKDKDGNPTIERVRVIPGRG
ncbi:ESPR-type extended signal peptide-containing protein [Veillonella criceti]|uniref:Outer membrane protein alpha n=1 Tax=Veillonella criceti TaxID=103891 RepID=A0A380NNU1_9FIRM|nr:ESPR-type extended signal peptide-containing protein [Veillonella criceti]SUP44387.1 Outer membrane protein alpha precursor [Veillonella criceti]